MNRENLKDGFKQVFILMVVLSFFVSLTNFYFYFKYPMDYNNIIINEANASQINTDFVSAIIAVESRFNKDAISSSGAMGLMQLMPNTAIQMAEQIDLVDFELDGLFEPDINIRLGTTYIRYLMNKFTNVRTVLAAYNAGEGKVMEWLIDINYSPDGYIILNTPYKETNAYIERVLNALKIYRNKTRANIYT